MKKKFFSKWCILSNSLQIVSILYIFLINLALCIVVSQPVYALEARISSNSPICEGQTLYLYTDSVYNATYQWYGPNDFFSEQRNPVIQNTTSDMSGVYSSTIIYPNFSTETLTIDVVINPAPAYEIQGEKSICKGDSTILAIYPTSDKYKYKWSNGSTKSYITAKDEGTYSVEVTNEFNCNKSAEFYLYVKEKPLIEITGDTVFCIDETGIVYIKSLNEKGKIRWAGGSTSDSISVNTSCSLSALSYYENGCISSDTIDVRQIHKTVVDLWLPDTAILLNIKDVCIKLKAKISYFNGYTLPEAISLKISFNSNVIQEVYGSSFFNTPEITEDGRYIITIDNDNFVINENDEVVVCEFCGQALLKDELYTSLKIEDVRFDKHCIEPRIKDGSLQFTGCVILLSKIQPIPNSKISINPNPSSDFINIDIQSSETGELEYSIFTIEGSLCEHKEIRLQGNNKELNNYYINHNIKNYPQGSYFIVFKTDNCNIVKPIYILK